MKQYRKFFSAVIMLLCFIETHVAYANSYQGKEDDRRKAEEFLESKKLTGEKLKKFFEYKPGERYIGVHPDKAKVVVVEYGSLTCPHCKDVFFKTTARLKARYIDTGKSVSIIHRLFVSDARAYTAMMELECKKHDDAKYNRLLSSLYASQSNWAFTSGAYAETLFDIFSSYGYTRVEFIACLANERLRERLLQDRIDVIEKGGLRGTPTVVVNGKVLIDFSDSGIISAIDAELKS